jgi:hypothetical protein
MTSFEQKERASLIGAGVAEALRALGLTSGEISQSQASAVYGRWFRDKVAEGKIAPCRMGEGKTSTRWYRVSEILQEQARDYAAAALQAK